MDFFAGVVDFFINVLGDVFITWMQRLAALDRKRYIVVYILLLLAIAAGAAAAWVRGVYPLAIALTILLPLALLLFVLGLRKPPASAARPAADKPVGLPCARPLFTNPRRSRAPHLNSKL